jgi:hypothetical protein
VPADVGIEMLQAGSLFHPLENLLDHFRGDWMSVGIQINAVRVTRVLRVGPLFGQIIDQRFPGLRTDRDLALFITLSPGRSIPPSRSRSWIASG